MTKARPTVASLTYRRSTSSWWLFSALAIAACSTFLTSCATRRREKVSSATAVAALLPRIVWATRFNLRGLVRIARRKAEASLSSSRRSAEGFPISFSSAPSRPLVAGMAVEGPGRRELAEFVADHVLGHQHRDEFVPVIDAEGQPNELREDRRPPGPRPDHFVAARGARLFRLFQHIAVDEGAFPYRACHAVSPLIVSADGGG